MIKLREYQKEALNFALEMRKSVILMPTGTGKTFVGLFFIKELINKNPSLRAIVLEPTRILVEQTYRIYKKEGLPVQKIYGLLKKDDRKKLWQTAKVVVTTPETAYNDIALTKDFDIIVVDECHHTIGEDAYVKFLRESQAEYRLGLSAYIPPTRKKYIESLIGEIKEWSIDDPKLRKYIPAWIGDIFDAPLNNIELSVYKEIERRRLQAKNKILFTLALKYLAVDGALALKDTLSRKNKISEALSDLRDKIFRLRDLHKLDVLLKVLKSYEGFDKAIIFVDRVVIVRMLQDILKTEHDIVVILGKKNVDQREALQKAKDAKIIISTSAGEEGIDLPAADLLIVWSNTPSPIRFIQRHGRIMRPLKRIKFVTYIITPDTIDVDLFLNSIFQAKRYVDIGIFENILHEIWKKSPRKRILELLEDPLPVEWIREISGYTISEIRSTIRYGLKNGDIVYIYTNLGKTYIKRDKVKKLYDLFKQYLTPKYNGKVRMIVNGRRRTMYGDYKVLVKNLIRYLPLNGLIVIREKQNKDIIEYDPRKYEFIIDCKELLEIVLKNALSF
ncbi:MAG TPA: DEAD/DEAH box helicase [Candidatus Nanopusillus sp.]|nr:DEAD/DEAH box helicase [Candidatus Nanopusillus sp.]